MNLLTLVSGDNSVRLFACPEKETERFPPELWHLSTKQGHIPHSTSNVTREDYMHTCPHG